jgi:phage terminase small subunit
MGVPKRLTEMQKRFAEYLVFGGPEGPVNKAEAAKLAGYSEKRCRQEGCRTYEPKTGTIVVKYLDELKIEKMLKYGVTYESHISELARIKDLAFKKEFFLCSCKR